jgi:hypothetical protein
MLRAHKVRQMEARLALGQEGSTVTRFQHLRRRDAFAGQLKSGLAAGLFRKESASG